MAFLLIDPDFHIDPLLTLAQMSAEGQVSDYRVEVGNGGPFATSQVAKIVLDRETNVPQFKQKGS